jgi:glycosyltransferase involved in cell wall biosynthesis
VKIAITTPSNWPRVRRGAERFLNELARFLAARGHEVTLLTAHPGKSETHQENGFTVVTKRWWWRPWMEHKFGILEFHLFFFTTLFNLPRERYDIVFCSTFMDAFAASLVRAFTGTPCILWLNGLPPIVPYVRILSLKGKVFRRALMRADNVISLSRFMQQNLEQRFGRGGVSIPVPVDLDSFPLHTTRDHARPIVLCAAALEDYRKGGRLLMRAFNILKTARSEVRLQLASSVSTKLKGELLNIVSPEWRQDVQFLGQGELKDLPSVYGRAAISVLPSMWEPFGMVLTESLAAGTPTVGTRSGAIPEILSDPLVSRLFDPGPAHFVEPSNAEGLAAAMAEALDLSRDPATAPRCRRFVERYAWSTVGRELETLLLNTAVPNHAVDRKERCASS